MINEDVFKSIAEEFDVDVNSIKNMLDVFSEMQENINNPDNFKAQTKGNKLIFTVNEKFCEHCNTSIECGCKCGFYK